jgi:hypothetical protein
MSHPRQSDCIFTGLQNDNTILPRQLPSQLNRNHAVEKLLPRINADGHGYNLKPLQNRPSGVAASRQSAADIWILKGSAFCRKPLRFFSHP